MILFMIKKCFYVHMKKKTKFRYLLRKGHDQHEIKKEVLSCVEQHYNDFNVTSHMCKREQQIQFEPIDIVYKPVKRIDNIIECYFSNEINLTVYRKIFSESI